MNRGALTGNIVAAAALAGVNGIAAFCDPGTSRSRVTIRADASVSVVCLAGAGGAGIRVIPMRAWTCTIVRCAAKTTSVRLSARRDNTIGPDAWRQSRRLCRRRSRRAHLAHLFTVPSISFTDPLRCSLAH